MMGEFLKSMGILLVAMMVTIFIYNLLKLYVFSKFKPVKGMKWIMAAVTVIAIFADSFIGTKYGSWSWQYVLGMAVFMFCLVSAFDLFGWGASKNNKNSKSGKGKDFVIKPKAKPNRAKKKQ